MNFGHTPYDTLPFYQERSFWNLFGYGALVRRLAGIPLPGPEFFGDGIKIEAMGAAQVSAATQAAVEQKVRKNAEILEKAPYGYRSAVGFQAGRLMARVNGPEYGLRMNAFNDSTPFIPASPERFDKRFERRGPGFSKIQAIETPTDGKLLGDRTLPIPICFMRNFSVSGEQCLISPGTFFIRQLLTPPLPSYGFRWQRSLRWGANERHLPHFSSSLSFCLTVKTFISQCIGRLVKRPVFRDVLTMTGHATGLVVISFG